DERPDGCAPVRARPDRCRLGSSAARCIALARRHPRRPQPGANGTGARPKGGRRRDRAGAGCARPHAGARSPADANRVAALRDAAQQVRTALSAPLRLLVGARTLTLEPTELAALLELPGGGSSKLAIGGKTADAWL